MVSHFVLVVNFPPGALTPTEGNDDECLCLPPHGEQWIYVGTKRPRCASDMMRMIRTYLQENHSTYTLNEVMIADVHSVLMYKTEDDARFAVKHKRMKLELEGRYFVFADVGDCRDCGERTRDHCILCYRHACIDCNGLHHPMCRLCASGKCIACRKEDAEEEWLLCDKCVPTHLDDRNE